MDKKPSSVYVLDSYALLAHFQGEPSAVKVRDLLESALTSSAISLYMSIVNVGEIYYLAAKKRGLDIADEILVDLEQLPLTICQAMDDRVMAAARAKATYPISYADAFAVALAEETGGRIVTGDPEFEAIEPQIPVVWL